MGRNVEFEALKELLCLGGHGSIRDGAKDMRLVPEENILSHGQIRHERKLLEDCVNSLPLRVGDRFQRDFLSAKENPSSARRRRARQHRYEGRFARPVFSENDMNLARVQVEIHVIDRDELAVLFRQPFGGDQ